jgi:hypothetical protein
VRAIARANHALTQGWKKSGIAADGAVTFEAKQIDSQWCTEITYHSHRDSLFQAPAAIDPISHQIYWITCEYRAEVNGYIGGMAGGHTNYSGYGMLIGDSTWRVAQGAAKVHDRNPLLWVDMLYDVAPAGQRIWVRNLTLWDAPVPVAWDGTQWKPEIKGWDGSQWEDARFWDGSRWLPESVPSQVDTWSPWMEVKASPSGTGPEAWFNGNATHYDGGDHHRVMWRYSPTAKIVEYRGLAKALKALDYGEVIIVSSMDPGVLPKPTTLSMSFGLVGENVTSLWTGMAARYDCGAHATYHHQVQSLYVKPGHPIPNGMWFNLECIFPIGGDL